MQLNNSNITYIYL